MVKKLGSHSLDGNAVITKHVRVCFKLLLPIIIFIYNFFAKVKTLQRIATNSELSPEEFLQHRAQMNERQSVTGCTSKAHTTKHFFFGIDEMES